MKEKMKKFAGAAVIVALVILIIGLGTVQMYRIKKVFDNHHRVLSPTGPQGLIGSERNGLNGEPGRGADGRTIMPSTVRQPPATTSLDGRPAGALDYEPQHLTFYHTNPAFMGATVELRDSLGNKVSGTFQDKPWNHDGIIVHIAGQVQIPGTDFLTHGPYLVTVRRSTGSVIATFRVDRTGEGKNSPPSFRLFIQKDGTPALSLNEMDTWQPLGREIYPPKMEG